MTVTAKRVLEVARRYLGYHEIGDNVTQFAEDLDKTEMYNGPKNGYAWCDLWCDYCVWEASGRSLSEALYVLCQPLKSAGAGCLYSAQYYKAAGRWGNEPREGAQIFFHAGGVDYGHTGLVERFDESHVYTIEGNTSDMVARRTYNRFDACINGYGYPRYAEEDGEDETEQGENDEIIVEPDVPESGPQSALTPTVWQTMKTDLPLLKPGAYGAPVKNAQRLLIGHGYSCGGKIINGHEEPDGKFAAKTEEAVRAFQALFGLEIDGEIGCQTWAALVAK